MMFTTLKEFLMADFEVTREVPQLEKDPRKTICTCGQSVYLPAHPTFHCPKCHATYISRSMNRPAYCAQCKFPVRKWRSRNNIPDIRTPFP
jgi:ribosomal protein S27AE